MRLTTKFRYGSRAVLEIARGCDACPVKKKDIALNQNIPESYLENILIDLKKGGLIRATRGPRGGFTLRGKPENISLLDVAAVFESYPQTVKSKLLFLRELIFETASSIESVGEIEETLKWGEPSYLTPITKSGSTIRIAWKEAQEDQYSMFFKCTANLVPAFKEKYPKKFNRSGSHCKFKYVNR